MKIKNACLSLFIIFSILSSSFTLFFPLSSPILAEEQTDLIDFIDFAIENEHRVKVTPDYARGEDWETTFLGDNGTHLEFKTTIGIPTQIWSESESSYQPYIFIDKYVSDGYYEVSNGRIGVRIYDYYAMFFNSNFSEVRLYDERWTVERYRPQGQGSWSDVGAQSGSPIFSIVYNDESIHITKSFESWAGQFNITYSFVEGAALKHTIIFTSILEDEIFRVKQLWSGIVGDRVKYENIISQSNNEVVKGQEIISGQTIINGSYFTFLKNDGSQSIIENQHSAIEWLEPVILNTHTQGMKADFIFSNWTLSQGESLVIDPLTFTASNPTKDASACMESGTAEYANNFGSVNVMAAWRYSANTCVTPGIIFSRGYVEWNITPLNDNADVSNTVFKYKGITNSPADNSRSIYQMSNQPTASSGQTIYDDAADGNAYLFTDFTFPIVGNNQQFDLGADADSDLETSLAGAINWWAIGIRSTELVNNKGGLVCSEEMGGGCGGGTPDPTLEVTYIIPNAPPSNDAVTITDFDDGDNIYSQQGYTVTLNSSDADGATEIQNISLGFTDGVTSFNMTADTSGASVSVSIISGTGTWFLGPATNITLGNTQNVTFLFWINWNATDALNIELNMRTCDLAVCTAWEEKRTNYADIETDITQANFALDDDRGNPSVTLTATWTLTYEGSAVRPPDGNFTTGCTVHNPAHASQGTATTPSTGVCTVNDITASASVESVTYHPFMNGLGQYPDGDVGATTDAYISDKKNITITIGASPIDVGVNASIAVTAVNVFDGSASDSTLNLNFTVFIQFTPITKTYTVSSVDPDGTFGITVIDVNDIQSVTWEITPGELRSIEDFIGNDTTTNTVYEDVDGLSINITIPFETDILIMASIQSEANVSAVASYRLVFDGTNFQGLRRQVGTLAGNIVLVDLVDNKGAGNYELKLQHNISAGKLSTINTTIYAVSLHNGNGKVPANDSFVVSETIASALPEDIAGLSTEITLQRTSHVWMALTWAGEYNLNNKEGNFTININGLNMETRFRRWPQNSEFGALSLITRTNDKLPNGTYTVKGVWQGDNVATLTGMNFSLVVFGGEANGTVAEFEIQKIVNTVDTTIATDFENFDDLTLNFTTPNNAHVMGFLNFDSEVNVINKDVYNTININGTDQEEMKRGHSNPSFSLGSVGQVVRTNDTLPTGIGNMTGRWHTDPAITATGINIILVSIVLFTEDSSLVDLTIIFHTGISQVLVGSVSKTNLSVTAITLGDTVNITSVMDSDAEFFRYEFSEFGNHSHFAERLQVMNQDLTVNSFALIIGGGALGGIAGVGFIIIVIAAGFSMIIFLATRRK